MFSRVARGSIRHVFLGVSDCAEVMDEMEERFERYLSFKNQSLAGVFL
jgi:hypothetical protein